MESSRAGGSCIGRPQVFWITHYHQLFRKKAKLVRLRLGHVQCLSSLTITSTLNGRQINLLWIRTAEYCTAQFHRSSKKFKCLIHWKLEKSAFRMHKEGSSVYRENLHRHSETNLDSSGSCSVLTDSADLILLFYRFTQTASRCQKSRYGVKVRLITSWCLVLPPKLPEYIENWRPLRIIVRCWIKQ